MNSSSMYHQYSQKLDRINLMIAKSNVALAKSHFYGAAYISIMNVPIVLVLTSTLMFLIMLPVGILTGTLLNILIVTGVFYAAAAGIWAGLMLTLRRVPSKFADWQEFSREYGE